MTAAALDPRLSVVVTVVDGGETLLRCLDALDAQVGAPPMEVIVPWDGTIADVAALARRFPRYLFLPLDELAPSEGPANAFVLHRRYDRRRAAGLGAAHGGLVAMLEDRGWPRPDWAASMASLHAQRAHGAIGGAIENGASGRLLHAIYYCDFGRYEPPLADGETEYVSDINVCYKRPALEGVRPLWNERYQEAEVNWALASRGDRPLLCNLPRVVQQRQALSLGEALRERAQWGRTFGIVRARKVSRRHGMMLAAAAPLVPVLLVWRHLRRQQARGRALRSMIAELPLVALLALVWAGGEAVGEIEAVLGRQVATNGTKVSPG